MMYDLIFNQNLCIFVKISFEIDNQINLKMYYKFIQNTPSADYNLIPDITFLY